jgi:hypothetical protein
MSTPLALLRKVRNHLHLLKNDPEKFGSNLLQLTNPAKFQEKLADVMIAAPLHVRVDSALSDAPALNVMQPILTPGIMTGGPNTVVNIAFWVAKHGIPVRIVTTRTAPGTDPDWFWRHLTALTGEAERPPTLSVASAADQSQPFAIGPRDVFLATHWTTAQQVKTQLPKMDVKRFFYLIQDFEPGFYAWSSNYALAMETYGLDHIGVFNESFLYDYLVAQGAGRYADPEFAARGLVFEPAIDRVNFHPPAEPRTGGKRRLLFYARPGNPRNMLGLGLNALRAAVTNPAFRQDEWEFLAIGGSGALLPISLGENMTLNPLPWTDYVGYGRLLRESDILLCPMLSPHTSYPVLEMAASGGITVTNSFGNKTRARLEAISANIIGAAPTTEGFADALVEAARRVSSGVDTSAPFNLPADWKSSLSATAGQMAEMFREIVGQAQSGSRGLVATSDQATRKSSAEAICSG